MSRMKIVEAMLKYSPPTYNDIQSKSPNFDSWKGVNPECRELLAKNPNAFLIGALFDFLIQSDDAWEVPYNLKKRLGHLDVDKISKMDVKQLSVYIKRNKNGKALHRFPNVMADRLISVCNLLLKKYQGNAENIWNSSQNIKVVIGNLIEFKGIDQKIANMFVNLLNVNYGLIFEGWSELDVAVDRHVARVFLRTSLIDSDQEQKIYDVAKVKRAIILSARGLHPKFPGALDNPAFQIGKFWCTAQEAKCNNGGNPCPLNKVCAKDKIDFTIS